MAYSQENFSKIRLFFWPVTKKESKKVLPLALMMFFVLFNYTILRDIKDCLILTAHGCGAESLSFLKLWGTLPFALLTMTLYSKLAISLSRTALFRTMIALFIVFFTIFVLFMFPNTNIIHASPEWIDQQKNNYPILRHMFALIGNWGFSIFYIMSELWGTVGLSVLFWQFANDVTKIKEAKRFYPLFGLISNFGVILAGGVLLL